MPSARETADLLVKYGVIPVIRYDNPDDGALAIDCALKAGFPTVEITLTMPDATELIRAFSRRLESHQLIGAGTVWTEQECEEVLHAGAAYIVSPGLAPGLGAVAHAGNAAYLPGAMTPTEIAACLRDGADIVKIFPASTLGTAHLKAVTAIFRDTRFCPTGGISADNMEEWFDAGAKCVGIGSSLFSGAAMRSREQKALVDEARHVMDLLSIISR
ncbi:MAG: 2-dehydro-3-deoxyphosphogluconate aldolase [Betaproteobacteria bacterium]|nr:2-dehydro-3-deoxyphosphogluconate aldolase [Betaproteobacteria bacterium]